MSYGEDIKRLRTERGLTQSELAELAGVSRTSISTYESGASAPGRKSQKKIAGALDVTVSLNHKPYICPKCGNTDHVVKAKFCMICGTKIKTQTDILQDDLRLIITDIIPHAPESMKDKERDTIRAACRWIEARGGD